MTDLPADATPNEEPQTLALPVFEVFWEWNSLEDEIAYGSL